MRGLPVSTNEDRVLILCVDHDDDIGMKIGVATPIVGRARNLTSASQLALIDPEESDANAIFGAVRVYDDLSKVAEIEEYEVATIVGAASGGITADRRLNAQLAEVLDAYPAKKIILVTDGYSDETVIPIVQSRLPIISVRRIVVKHSESIEESWAIFSRYLRTLIEDRYYARWALGAPGILLIVLAVIWAIDPIYVGMVLFFFIGALLLTKGFRLDEKIVDLIFPSPPNLIRLLTVSTASILLGLDVYQGYTELSRLYGEPTTWWTLLPQVVGSGLGLVVDLAVIAACILLIGYAVYFYFTHDTRIWWTIVGVISSLWMREVTLRTSAILLASTPVPATLINALLLAIGLGIATTVLTVLVMRGLGQRFKLYFEEVDRIDES
jgi:putative membrane protein